MTIVSGVRIIHLCEQIKNFIEKARIRLICHKKFLRDNERSLIFDLRASDMDRDEIEITPEEYQMLKIIEKETGIPVEVQVMHALAMWQTKHAPKGTKKP